MQFHNRLADAFRAVQDALEKPLDKSVARETLGREELPQTDVPAVAEVRALETMNAKNALDAWLNLPTSTRRRIRKAIADLSWNEEADDRHDGDSIPMIVCGLFALGVQSAELLAGRTLAEL